LVFGPFSFGKRRSAVPTKRKIPDEIPPVHFPPPAHQQWLKGSELCRHVGITGMTLWRWLKDKKLGFPPPTKIRSRKYWNRADVDAWMTKRSRNAA
jgi:predicted DNA-binding transcriptional regulator AlpA